MDWQTWDDLMTCIAAAEWSDNAQTRIAADRAHSWLMSNEWSD